jgi:hypothetical protein
MEKGLIISIVLLGCLLITALFGILVLKGKLNLNYHKILAGISIIIAIVGLALWFLE